MSRYNFESMPPQDIAVTIFNNADPAQVAPMFEELKTLERGKINEYVVNVLEDNAAALIQQDALSLKLQLGVAKIFGQKPDFSAPLPPEQAGLLQANAEMIREIVAIKGDDAHPLLKSFVEVVDNMTLDEYNSGRLVLARLQAAQLAKNGQAPEEDYSTRSAFNGPAQKTPSPPSTAPNLVGPSGKPRHFKF